MTMKNDIGDIDHWVDTGRYPIQDETSPARAQLLEGIRRSLEENGCANLPGFLREAALSSTVPHLEELMQTTSFRHVAHHNIYFKDEIEGLAPDHPALTKLTTSHNTLTADQLTGTALDQVFRWPPLADFLAELFGKPKLYPMADPLAALNVMGYGEGDGIAWHFDRAEFTVTILLQAPEKGSMFRYVHNLRSRTDENYDAVAKMLLGESSDIIDAPASPGTLTIFQGYRSAHCVTPNESKKRRLVSVLSYMEQPDVLFSAADRVRFYGRAEPFKDV